MSGAPRLAPRGSELPSNIEACLQMLSEIIQKYNDQDEDDEPQEVDYLLAMDLLKRINDIKGLPAAAVVPAGQQRIIQTVTQVVIQWRERETTALPLQRLQLASSAQVLQKQSQYEECSVCHHLVKDAYSLSRHMKRISCKRIGILKSMTDKFKAFIGRLNVKFVTASRDDPCVISEAFLLSLSFLHMRAQPIIRRPKPNHSVPLVNGRPFPQRLLPKMLWKSIWDPRGSFHDEAFLFPKDSKRMLVYDPSMFFGRAYPRENMERKTLTAWPFTRCVAPSVQIWTTYQLQNWKDSGPWGGWSMVMVVDVADDEEEV